MHDESKQTLVTSCNHGRACATRDEQFYMDWRRPIARVRDGSRAPTASRGTRCYTARRVEADSGHEFWSRSRLVQQRFCDEPLHMERRPRIARRKRQDRAYRPRTVGRGAARRDESKRTVVKSFDHARARCNEASVTSSSICTGGRGSLDAETGSGARTANCGTRCCNSRQLQADSG